MFGLWLLPSEATLNVKRATIVAVLDYSYSRSPPSSSSSVADLLSQTAVEWRSIKMTMTVTKRQRQKATERVSESVSQSVMGNSERTRKETSHPSRVVIDVVRFRGTPKRTFSYRSVRAEYFAPRNAWNKRHVPQAKHE